jgi:hypothetical protein
MPRPAATSTIAAWPTLAAGSRVYLLANLEAKESILRVHLIPELGSLPLGDVNSRAIETHKAKKLSEGLSPKTVNNPPTVLRNLLSVALEWEIIEAIPPVKWLGVPPQKFAFLSFEEVEKARGGSS